MTKEQIQSVRDDIAFMRALAEEGRRFRCWVAASAWPRG